MLSFLALLFLVAVAVSRSNPLQPQLLLTPSVVTAFVGEDVTFLCIKDDPSLEIAWITQLNVFLSNNKNVSKLVTGVPDISFNNTEIQCIGRYPSDPNQLYFSNVGKVIIQGILSEIDVNVSRMDFCTIQFSWVPPFTLPDVPILGYNVNITNLGKDITNHTFINNTAVNITLGYDYYVSIAAVNGAGEGNKTNLTINSTEQVDSTKEFSINSVDLKRDDDKWKVDTIIDVIMICEVADANFAYKFCNYTASCFMTKNITRISPVLLSSLLFLPEDQHFFLHVEANFGRVTLSSSDVNLSTFDVQSVKETNSSADGIICLAIYYVAGSAATGCQINLECDRTSTFLFHIDGYNDQFHKFWCSQKLDRPWAGNKTCLLQVYDRVDRVNQNTSGPALTNTIYITGTKATVTPSVTPKDCNCHPKVTTAAVVPTVVLVPIIAIMSIIIVLMIICYFKAKKKDSFQETITLTFLSYPKTATATVTPKVEEGKN